MPFVGLGVGVGRQRFRGGFVGLLDEYSGAAAAYSLRQLSASYTGDAIRVRRASDNTEQDIGFVNNVLDTASLTTFCSGTDGFVTTWYDQSGNAVDATQSTAANQPQIVSSGSVILENGKPSFYFNGLDQGFIITSAITTSLKNSSYFVCLKLDTNSGHILTNNTSIGRIAYNFGSNDTFILSDGSNALVAEWDYTNNFSQSLYSILNQSSISDLYINSNLITNIIYNITTQNLTIGRIALKHNSGTGLPSLEGKMQEIILYTSDQTSNVNGIETNINNFYSIY